jgi:hypothetical protein
LAVSAIPVNIGFSIINTIIIMISGIILARRVLMSNWAGAAAYGDTATCPG